MATNIGYIEEKPSARRELLAVAIFMVPLFGVLLGVSSFPHWLNIILVIIFWEFVIYAVVLAVIKRFPRWSLSYLGVL